MRKGTRKSGAVMGLNLSHDRSACLIVDGRVRVAIAEERLSRLKHDIPVNSRLEQFCQAPIEAIKYCMDAACLTLNDIELVVASTAYVYNTKTAQRRTLRVEDVMRQWEGLPPERVRILSHHFSHAVSTAWCSSFDDAAIIVMDGGGSIVGYGNDGRPVAFERTTLYRMEEQTLRLVQRSTGGPPDYGNSIGDFYQLINLFLGFRRGDEGKLMGLAAYGHLSARPERQRGGANRVETIAGV